MKNKFYVVLPIACAIILLILVVSSLQSQSTSQELISPIAQSQSNPNVMGVEIKEENNDTLSLAVQKALEGSEGSYAIVIKDMNTGKVYEKEENKSFEAASLYKLWIMGEVVRRLEDGTMKEEDVLSGEVKDLNERFKIATEAAELQDGTVSMTIKEALNEMITVSHNYAALLLSAKVRLSNVTKFLENQGLTESKLGEPPSTTAKEIALYLEKIYKKELVNMHGSEYMLELLKNQEKNSKLPKYLPKEVVMAHKTGEIGGFSHDAGIVYTNNGDYIIVVMSESDNPQGADERIANISQNVYAVFTEKN